MTEGNPRRMTSFEEVQERIFQRAPDLVLESEVQGWFYLGEYARGIAAYRNLKQPSAKDDRWLGDCLSMTRNHMEALEALYRAIAKGEEAAHIQLARVFNFVERSADAERELNGINPTQLSPADKVIYHRAQSIQEEYGGRFQQALKAADEAWRLVQGLPEFVFLAPWILIRLGRLQSQLGRAQRALWAFDRAVEVLSGQKPPYLSLSRVDGLISLGRYGEALAEIEALRRLRLSPADDALRLMCRADVAWATGNLHGAVEWYGQAIERAVEVTGSTEFSARLALVVLLGKQGAFEAAYEHLLRAQTLVNYSVDQAHYRFRETLLQYWRGGCTSEQARQTLEELIEEYGAMGLPQEQGWVRLHLAELHRAQGDDYLTELDKLQALGVVLQNKNYLTREWTLLPELHEAALLSHPQIAGKAPVVLEVYSMGEEKLVLGGKVVSIRLRRGLELLTYFLEHAEVQLRRLLLDVFPDDKPKSARIYFHQFRHELGERVPGLRIEYDAEARVYRLHSELDILWDVHEVRSGRKMGDMGIFLPSCGNEWAQEIEQEMEGRREEEARWFSYDD